MIWIGENSKRRGTLLEGLAQDVGVSTVEAHPGGVLPGAANAGKGQLQRGGGWVKAQTRSAEPIPQHAADAKPEGIAACQHHPRNCRVHVLERVHQEAGIVAVDQGCGLIEPSVECRLKSARCRNPVRLTDQLLLSRC